jgi:glutamate 5-kinase
MSAGCATVIAGGSYLDPVQRIEDGSACTWFLPNKTPLAARKQWIAGALTPRGVLVIDAGAEAALDKGKSLLPVGVQSVAGSFVRGDAVEIRNAEGRDLARGLVAYNSKDAGAVLGRKSREFAAILGYEGRNEMVHRDNLVLLDKEDV